MLFKIQHFSLLSLILLLTLSLTNKKLMGQDLPKEAIPAADAADRNNNFYDNSETYSLGGGEIEVAGEVENPGKVDFSKLAKHSVIVKETSLKDDGSNSFTGAYRYDGYSLFDVLADRIVKKKNIAEFRQVIDHDLPLLILLGMELMDPLYFRRTFVTAQIRC